MEKLQKFDILFDNPKGIFVPGQAVSGKVLIILTAPMETAGVSMKFNGQARVSWTEMKTMQQRKYEELHHMNDRHLNYITYNASESYFDHIIQLKGQSRSDTLLHGETFLPFSFKLPIGIPSSFEGSFGYIRYFCRAIIHCPWKFNSVCKMPFSVVSFLDLNQQPKAKEPLKGQTHKTVCCLCCNSGPVSIMAAIDRMGYVAGESILLNAEIENLTNKSVKSSKATFCTTIVYHARDRFKEENIDISEVKRGKLKARQSETWDAVPIPIPPVPPSTLGHQFIDIEYRLDFIVDLGRGSNLIVSLPLLIGTVPLRDYFGSFQTSVTRLTSLAPLPYRDAPVPSFVASSCGEVDIRDSEDSIHTHGKLKYTPLYTYYNVISY